MSEHPPDEHLRAFLDDRLGPDEATRIEAHVETCRRCQRALDEAEPRVPLPGTSGGGEWNERAMRRLVRRTLLRAAFDALSILVVILLVTTAVGGLVVRPLLVDRGDRVERVRAATDDLPVLLTPAAVPADVRSNAGVASQTHERTFVRYVGSEGRELGTFASRIGIWGWQPDPTGLEPWRLQGGFSATPRPFDPDRLPQGTVASVLLSFPDGIPGDEADALAAGHEEVTLQWVGFRVPVVERDALTRPSPGDFDVGYGACAQPTTTIGRPPESRSIERGPPGTALALEQARRATANLAASREIRNYLENRREPVLRQIVPVAEWLANHDPDVVAVVVTGPTDDIAAILGAAGPDDAQQLEIDLYNGPGSPCA